MSKKYRNKFLNIEQIAVVSVGNYFMQYGINDPRLVSNWKIIVRDFSNDFLPLKIIKKKKSDQFISVLYLDCKNENYPKSNLRFIKTDLIERINQFFGYKMIDDISIGK